MTTCSVALSSTSILRLPRPRSRRHHGSNTKSPPEPRRLPNESGMGGQRTLEVQLECPPVHPAAVNSRSPVGIGDHRDRLRSVGSRPAGARADHISDRPECALAGSDDDEQLCSYFAGCTAAQYSNHSNRLRSVASFRSLEEAGMTVTDRST